MSDVLKQPLTLATLREKRDAILALATRYKAFNVRVFGSVARGEATAESDVDFLVCFQPDYSLLSHAGLLVELRELLDCNVDVVNEPLLRDEYQSFILKDAVLL